jgi:hypothetical protein
LFGQKAVVVSSPEDVKSILTNRCLPRAWPSRLTKLFDEGKLQVTEHPENGGYTHPVIRRCFQSKTTGAGLQNLIPIINSLAQETVKAWVDNGVVDSVPDLNVVAAIARLCVI